MNALLALRPCKAFGVQLGHPCPSRPSVGEVLSPERIRATTGGIVTPTFCSAPPFQNRTILRKSPTSCHMNALLVSHPCETLGVQLRASMPVPLSKVRCCRPKEFGRLPEGLSHQPFAPHHPFKNRTILRKSPTPCLPCQREVA